MIERPLEVRLAAGIIAGAAAVFLGLAWLAEDIGTLRFPVGSAMVAVIVVGLLFTSSRTARVAAIGAVTLLALAHTLIALGGLPWWARTISGVLAAAHVYVVILLLTRPARVYFGGVPSE